MPSPEMTNEQLRTMARDIRDYPSELPRTVRVLADGVVRLLEELDEAKLACNSLGEWNEAQHEANLKAKVTYGRLEAERDALLAELRLERTVNEDMAPRFRETKMINAVLMNVLEAAESYTPHHDCDCWTRQQDAIAAARRLVPKEGK